MRSVRSVVNLLQLRKKNKIMAYISKPVRIMDIRGTYKGGGGPDKTVLMSAFHHDKRRVHILVAYLRDPKDSEFQITAMAKKLNINYVEVLDRKKIDFKCLFDLHNLIKKNELEIYHAHDDKTLLYGWLLKILMPGLKIIYTCHLLVEYERADFPSFAKYINYSTRKYISVLLMKRYLRPVMAVSGATKEQLRRKGFKKDEILVLYNGIDISSWRRKNGHPVLRDELKLGKEDFLVGTVARIDYQKDFPTFFKVASLVIAQIPNTKFVIVGDGKAEELSNLKQDVRQLGLDKHIYFTGHRSDLLNIYSSFDLFLMTSIMEGLPNTVLEAMAMEVPVVSTAVSGVPEVVLDGKAGYLCSIGDVDSLASKVVRLLEDEDLRHNFAINSRKRIIEKFSFIDRVKKLESLYEMYRKNAK